MSKEYKIKGYLYEESDTKISDSYLQLLGSAILANLASMDSFLRENRQISVYVDQEWAIQLTPYASITTDKLTPIIRILYRDMIIHQTILTPERYYNISLDSQRLIQENVYKIFKDYDTHPIGIQGVCSGSSRNHCIGFIRYGNETHAITDARIIDASLNHNNEVPFQGISICTQSLTSGKIGIYSAFDDQITYLTEMKG